MKYRIVDADNRAECSKPKTFEEVKAWFEPSAEFKEDHDKWAEIQDIDDMRDYLIWEAQGMRPNWRIEDCFLMLEKALFKILFFQSVAVRNW